MSAADRDAAGALERLAAGDESAIDEVLQAHLPDLRAFLRLRTGPLVRSMESTTDIVQSVCREILERRDAFRFPGEHGFRRWLYTTAMRKVAHRVEYYRAQKREAARTEALDEGAEGLLACYGRIVTPSMGLRAREEVDRIERAFDRLTPTQRELITLARIAGLTHREIAERTGKTEGSVRMGLFRALERLSAILEEHEAR